MMHLLNSSGAPSHTKIVLRTRLNNDIDNLQPWHYSSFEWGQLDDDPTKYEKLGAVRLNGMCPVYNCHGLTFGSRRTQVENSGNTISLILEDDGYNEVPEPDTTTGDVVIYYDRNGLVQHSGIVLDRGPMNVPKIWSKWGKGHEMVHPLGSCPWSGLNTRFYRITKWKFEEVFKQSL